MLWTAKLFLTEWLEGLIQPRLNVESFLKFDAYFQIIDTILSTLAMAAGPFSQYELDEIYDFAVDLGRKAGKLLMERVDQRISGATNSSDAFEEKENAVDIVTQTDEGKLTRAIHRLVF